uniref:Putative secreted protein n=1 Tax=Amblyomma cajennense TaxID=34607 RepID=A0A023FEA6_AMBCJ
MRRILLAIFALGLQLNTVASNGKRAKEPDKPIGENITVSVTAFYDSSYNLTKNHEVTENTAGEDPMQRELSTLFGKVQKHFHKQNITINITMVAVSKNDTFSVRYEQQSLNATETLNKVKNAASLSGAPKTSAFFLFSELGSERYTQFSQEDRKKMEQTFKRCSGNEPGTE